MNASADLPIGFRWEEEEEEVFDSSGGAVDCVRRAGRSKYEVDTIAPRAPRDSTRRVSPSRIYLVGCTRAANVAYGVYRDISRGRQQRSNHHPLAVDYGKIRIVCVWMNFVVGCLVFHRST